uniref:Uncharacterized protein n=1 Tax=Glossina austeni TaxID=7395 RepID=A0A1A9UD06_GLOAU
MAAKLFTATVLLHSLPLVNLTGVVLRDSSKTEFSKLVRSSSDTAPASFAVTAAVSKVRELNPGNSEIGAARTSSLLINASFELKGRPHLRSDINWGCAGSFSKKILRFILLTVVFVGLADGGKSEDEVCTAADVVVADDYGVPLDLH